MSWTILSFYAHFSHRYRPKPTSRKRQQGDFYDIFRTPDPETDPLAGKSWIPVPFCGRVPVEPIVKMVLTGLGMLAELLIGAPTRNGVSELGIYPLILRYTTRNDTDYVKPLGTLGAGVSRYVHIAEYGSFFLFGVVDLLSIYLPLPVAASPLYLTLALGCQALLFNFHTQGHDSINVAIHQILLLFIYISIVFSALRIVKPRNLMINSGLSCSLILQGLALLQGGIILYSTSFVLDPFEPYNIQFISANTTWMLHVTCTFMLVVFLTIRKIMHRSQSGKYMPVLQEEEELVDLLDHTEEIMMPGSAPVHELDRRSVREDSSNV